MKNGDLITFRLDGRWEGHGKVVNLEDGDRVIEVELTHPCKEFPTGKKILIDDTEITSRS